MRKFIHKELAAGKWFHLSLLEQMANIGSEVSRAAKWQGKDKETFQATIDRALELFDLTLEDKRWRGRLREIARMREVTPAFAPTVIMVSYPCHIPCAVPLLTAVITFVKSITCLKKEELLGGEEEPW